MFVLGISGVFGHDPAACLLRDGRVVAMVEEERLTRHKHAFGELPIHATLFCLNEAGITFSDLSCIAASWNPLLDPSAAYLQEFGRQFLNHEVWLPFRQPPLEFVDHHVAHAASAFYSSGYEEAAIIVIDGNGEDVATSIGYGQGRNVRLDQKIGVSHSLGHLYKYATRHVGLGTHDEGKLMGLAAYGHPVHDLSLIHLDNEGYHIDLADVDALPGDGRYQALFEAWDQWLVEQFGPPNRPRYIWDANKGGLRRELDLFPANANLAASVQQAVSETLIHLARIATTRYHTRRLVLAGGVALNCTANGAVLRSGVVDELYIVPAAHDAGGALGAAQYYAARETSVQPLASPYLGPCFEDAVVADQLQKRGIIFVEPADVADYTADLLAAGRIVGWFQGRMEVGPRALGNRSILALPNAIEVRDRVNQLKGRELWRPLSPSILATAVPDLLTDTGSSPYMLTAVSVTELARTVMPAVVHVDGTVRPQTVTAEQEPYWRLLQAVYAHTGIPAILNTSFNLAGEPIVCSPSDAVRSFFSSELDALVVGNLVVHKPGEQGMVSSKDIRARDTKRWAS